MTRADFASTFPKANTPSRAMTDNVKALNLYTADMADGYINEADEAITTGANNGLKIEDNGKTTDLGFQLGADFNDPQWDALLDELTVNEMEICTSTPTASGRAQERRQDQEQGR